MNNRNEFIAKYSNSFVEVLEIIKFWPDEIKKKIPKSKIEVFNTYKNKNYNFKYDESKKLDEQKIMHETKVLLAYLYRDFVK